LLLPPLSLFFSSARHLRALPSFPTRRSSDLCRTGHAYFKQMMREENAIYGGEMSAHHYFRDFSYCDSGMLAWLDVVAELSASGRSEEHTSELQSRENLVCRLLLEKKKKKTTP